MGYTPNSMNRRVVITALLAFFISSFFAMGSSWAIFCNLNNPLRPLCESSNGDDRITITNCTSFQNPNCDSVKDVIVTDQFNQVTLLDIDALGMFSGSGDDNIVMEYAFGAITVPVSVVGESGNNQLKIFNGGTQELIRIRPDGLGAMIELIHSSDIAFEAINSFSIDNRGENNVIIVYGDSEDNTFSFNSGDSAGSGSLDWLDFLLFPKVSFTRLGENGLFGIIGEGGMNTMTLRGTEGTDAYIVDSPSNTEVNIQYANTLNIAQLNLRTDSIQAIALDGLGGDDFFQIEGPFDAASLVIFGGDYGLGNQLEVTASSSLTVAPVDLGIEDASGNFIGTIGIQSVVLDMVQNDLAFSGFAPNSEVTYSPVDAAMGTLAGTGQVPFYQFEDVAGLSLDTAGAGNVVLKVPGLPGPNSIEILEDVGGPVITVDQLLPASFTGFDLISVDGGGDDDEFDVSPLTDTAIVVDGGPHGLGDELEYEGLGLEANVGDSSIVSAGKKPVSYFNMEIVDLEDVIFGEVPPGGSVEFSTAIYRYQHDDQVAVVTVKRNGSGIGAVSVDYATSDGTGIDGVDYLATSGTLNWAHGDTQSRTFNIPLIERGFPRSEKTVNLSLSNLETEGGAELGNFTNAIVLIESSLAGADQAGNGSSGGDAVNDDDGNEDDLSDGDDQGAGVTAAPSSGGCQFIQNNGQYNFGVLLLVGGILALLIYFRRSKAQGIN